MNILSYDCSKGFLSVALSSNGDVVGYLHEPRYSMQAEAALPSINKVLKDCGLDIGDIDYVATMRGPGSFTGIRIGLAIANAIKLAIGQSKIVGLSHFQLMYWKMHYQVKKFDVACTIIKGVQDRIYIEFFDNTGSSIKGPKALFEQDLEKEIKEFSEKKIICFGDLCHKMSIYNFLASQKNISVLPRFKILTAPHICRAAHKILCSPSNKLSGMSLERAPLSPLYVMEGIF